MQTEVGDHEKANECQYEECLQRSLHVRRFEEEPPEGGDDHDEEHDERGYVRSKGDDRIENVTQKTEAESSGRCPQ